jgi:hypothetical protein
MEYYSSQKQLFCEKLGLPNASLATMVAEVRRVTHLDSLGWIREIFIKLAQMAKCASLTEIWNSGLYELFKFDIFPGLGRKDRTGILRS